MADGTDGIIVSKSTVLGRRRTDGLGLFRTGEERIITVDGKHGLFTPLASEAEDGQPGMDQLVVLLRNELTSLREENLQLKQQLQKVLERPPRSPDDFATAVSHSVDNLQQRLSDMHNPVSNFAVREMSIETNVHVDVTPLGTIDYRFVQPGDNVEPHKLSKLKLTLCPIPKEPADVVPRGPDFTPMHDVADIQGVGETWRRRLNEHNIYTVSDLLRAGSRARSKVELEALLDVDRQRLGEWLAHADLLTLKDIDGRNAEVLSAIGIKSLAELGVADPQQTTENYNAYVAKLGQASHLPVTLERVKRWITVAKAYSAKPSVTAPEAPQSG